MGCGHSTGAVYPEKKNQISIMDFRVCSILGKGGCGKVVVCSHLGNGQSFAIKYLPKTLIRADKCDRAISHAIVERNFLEYLNHPSIVNLQYSFQDSEFLYIVLKSYDGGDLRRHMMHRVWREEECRPVICELISALKYLHSISIVHRDLKPDNILMDMSGHVYISDFDLARVYTKKGITSLAGTEPYMAPEIYTGEAYTVSPDFWSLGVTLFEMLFGERPFRTKNRKENIKKGKFEYPSKKLGPECTSLINGFLTVSIKDRLGAANINKLLEHAWFKGINWHNVHDKKISPVYIPPKVCLLYRGDVENDLLAYTKKYQGHVPFTPLEEFKYFDCTTMRRRKFNLTVPDLKQKATNDKQEREKRSSTVVPESEAWLIRRIESHFPSRYASRSQTNTEYKERRSSTVGRDISTTKGEFRLRATASYNGSTRSVNQPSNAISSHSSSIITPQPHDNEAIDKAAARPRKKRSKPNLIIDVPCINLIPPP